MSRVIFISYANDAMAWSLKRIGRQARRLGLFDEVILYTPADVPDYVRSYPMFKYPQGAGFWCWKPAMIYETLQRYEEGDIVVYVDAGCTLRKTIQWSQYIRLMKKYDTICFQYDEDQPQWVNLGCTSSKLKHWTKKKTLEFNRQYFGRDDIGEIPQILGGILFMKGKNNAVLRQWKDLLFSHYELITNSLGEERQQEPPEFIVHRHDQTLLTPLAVFDPDTLVLPETVEQYTKDSFVWASRLRAGSLRQAIPMLVMLYLRAWIGNDRIDRLKKRVAK